MTTTNATAHVAAASGAGATQPASNPKGMLGQNDFLKLMIAQLQAQDPLQPANTNEYISELAQFTQVEQTTNLANANELSSAVALIGRTVHYNGVNGGPGVGKVESVQSSSSGTTVTIEGTPGVSLSSITDVR
jgi:flagellar basal-body rod modification protein FlgD